MNMSYERVSYIIFMLSFSLVINFIPAQVLADPTVVVDIDKDGLLDIEEDLNNNRIVDIGETSFLLRDSDADGYDDGMEVTHGSDPLDSSRVPAHEDPERLTCLADAAQSQFSINSAASMFIPASIQPELPGAFNLLPLSVNVQPIALPIRVGGTIFNRDADSLAANFDAVALGSNINGTSPYMKLKDGNEYLFVVRQDGFLQKLNDVGVSQWSVNMRRSGVAGAGDSIATAPMVQLRSHSNQVFQDRYSHDNVYVATRYNGTGGTTENRIYAINADTGSIVWTFNRNAKTSIDASLQGLVLDYSTNRLYVGTDRTASADQHSLWSIDTVTATLDWSFDANQLYAKPMLINDRIYVVNLFGITIAIDKKTGVEIWRHENNIIPHLAGAAITQTKEGEVLIARADFDGMIRLVRDDGSSGTLVWEVLLPNDVTVSEIAPVFGLADQSLYVGADDGKVYQLELATGEVQSVRTIDDSATITSLAILDTDRLGRAPALYSTTSNGGVAKHCFPFRDTSSLTDSDLDKVVNSVDNCPDFANQLQQDTDLDGLGDSCDIDADNDTILNLVEEEQGTNPLLFDSDGDRFADNLDNCPLVANNQQDNDNDGIGDACDNDVAPEPQDLTLLEFDDVNGDGVADWLGYDIQGTDISISLLSGDDLVSLIGFTTTHNFDAAQVHKLGDHNADGTSEIGIYGFDSELNRYQLIAHDGLVGQKLATFNWPATLVDAQLEILADLTNDGIQEYAINGIHNVNGTRQLVVRNGATSAAYRTFKWPNLWDNTQIVTMSDISGDGIPEVALYGRHIRIDKGQLFVIDGADNTKIDVYNWNKLWDEIELFKMDDVDGDGTADWGQFGKRKDDGRYQWVVKKGHDKRGVIRTFSWPADLDNVSPMLVADRTDDGVREVAITGVRNASGKIFLRINDGKLANQRIANVSWPSNWEDQQVKELGDLNGDGFNEYAMLGYLKTNRTVQLVVKDGQTLAEYGRYTLAGDWDELVLSSSDVNADGNVDVMISGINETTDTREFTFLDGANLEVLWQR